MNTYIKTSFDTPQSLARNVLLKAMLGLDCVLFAFALMPGPLVPLNLWTFVVMGVVIVVAAIVWLGRGAWYASQGLLAVLYVYFVSAAWLTGGIHSIAIDWITFLPACTLFLGWRSTLFWSLSTVSVLVGFLLMELQFGSISAPPSAQYAWWGFVVELGVLFGFVLISNMYNDINSLHIKNLLKQKRILLRKRNELIKTQSHKDQFIAMVSHEVKNPIHALLGFTELMSQNDAPQQVISHVKKSANQLLQIVNDILTLSQLQEDKVKLDFEHVAIGPWLVSIIEKFSKEYQLCAESRIEVLCSENFDRIIPFDLFRVEQIIYQLLNNAVKFSNGKLIKVILCETQFNVEIKIVDQGIGIAESELNKIFMGFEHANTEVQHRYGGTGLGLAICKRLAYLHQGDISVQSTLGSGSSFTLTLPQIRKNIEDESILNVPVKPVNWLDFLKNSLLRSWNQKNKMEKLFIAVMQLIFSGMLYYIFLAPAIQAKMTIIAVMLITQGISFFILKGVNFVKTIYTFQITTIGSILYLCIYSGGIFSTTVIWLKLLMLAPVHHLGRQSHYAWLSLLTLSLGLMSWLTYMNDLPSSSHVYAETISWSFSGHLHLLGFILILPLIFKFDRKSIKNNLIAQNENLIETQQSLIQQKALKDQFILTSSHALRTPMNVIMGFIDLLHEESHKNEAFQELLDLARQSAQHLLMVIDDILDSSQSESGKIILKSEVFDLQKTIRHAFQMFEVAQSLPQIALNLEIETTCRWVKGDVQRLTQILVNLLSNSVKFTHRGTIKLNVSESNGGFLFVVSDTGDGISPEKLNQIFNRFEQVDKRLHRLKGHGLGLSITQRFIEAADGWIKVESVLGEGTKFSFWLNFERAKSPCFIAKESKKIKEKTYQTTILVVDDQPLNRLLAKQVLLKDLPQCTCIEAVNGLDAIEKLRSTQVDLILMDVLMPDMDGIAATQFLRNSSEFAIENTPILGLTANANQQTRERCLQAGMVDVIFKPFNKADLLGKIEEYLKIDSKFGFVA